MSSPESPVIPERLQRLPELASDLWWTWNPQARQVFRNLDYTLWRQTAHNPVMMLRSISAEMLVAKSVRFGDLSIDGEAIYWTESRPEE